MENLIEASSIDDAARWMQAILLGTVATLLGVIAIACVGVMMLAGRLPWRRAVEIVVGMFLIFGASAIAQGLIGQPTGIADAPIETAVPRIAVQTSPPIVYDPYAGASVPPDRSTSDIARPIQ